MTTSYFAVLSNLIYFLTSDDANTWSLIKFLPDLAVMAHDLLLEYFDIDWLSETEYALLYDIFYTNVSAEWMGIIFYGILLGPLN